MIVAKDKSEALVTYVNISSQGGDAVVNKVRLKGLDPMAFYRIDGSEIVVSGQMLMESGMYVELLHVDYASTMVHLTRL